MSRYIPPPSPRPPLSVIRRTLPRLNVSLKSDYGSPPCNSTTSVSQSWSNRPDLSYIKTFVAYVNASYEENCAYTATKTISAKLYVNDTLYGSTSLGSVWFETEYSNETPQTYNYRSEVTISCSSYISGNHRATLRVNIGPGALNRGTVVIDDIVPGPLYGIVSDAEPPYFKFYVDGELTEFYVWRTGYEGEPIALIPIGKKLRGGERITLVYDDVGSYYVDRWDYLVIIP